MVKTNRVLACPPGLHLEGRLWPIKQGVSNQEANAEKMSLEQFLDSAPGVFATLWWKDDDTFYKGMNRKMLYHVFSSLIHEVWHHVFLSIHLVWDYGYK